MDLCWASSQEKRVVGSWFLMYISKRPLLLSSVSCIFIMSFPCKRWVVYKMLWKVHRSSLAALPVNPFNENGNMVIAETQAKWVPTGLDFEFRCVCVPFLVGCVFVTQELWVFTLDIPLRNDSRRLGSWSHKCYVSVVTCRAWRKPLNLVTWRMDTEL